MDKAERAYQKWNVRGDTCHSVGRFGEAVEHYEKCLRIATHKRNPMFEANAYEKLGICFLALGDCDKAMAYHFKALRIVRSLPFEKGEASCYCNLADCFAHRGDYQRVEELYKKSLDIGERIKDNEIKYKALSSLGSCYASLGQCAKATMYHVEALNLVKKTGNKADEGRLLTSLANHYMRSGQFDKAVKTFEESLSILKELGNKADEGGVHVNLAEWYYLWGHIDKALRVAETALALAKQNGYKKVEMNASGVLGTCYHAVGQFDKAMKHHEKALKIAKQIENKESEKEVYVNIGNTYKDLGQISEAIKYHEMALDIAKKTGSKGGEERAYGCLGVDHDRLGQTEKAIDYFEKALKIAQEIGDTQGEKKAHSNLGNSYSCLGHLEEARKHYEVSLEIARRIGDSEGEASIHGMLATYYQRLGQVDKAVECHKIALAKAQQAGKRVDEGKMCRNLGLFSFRRRRYKEAQNYLKQSMVCTEEQFGLTRGDSLKVSFLDTFALTYRLLCLTHLLLGKAEEALEIAERGRAKALAGLMLLRDPTVQGGTDIRGAKVLTLSEIRDVVKELGSSVVFFSLVPLICAWAIKPNGEIILGGNPIKEEESLFVMFVSKEGRFAGEIKELDDLIRKTMASLKSSGTMKCEDRSLSFLYHDEPGMKLWAQAGAAMSSTSTPEPAFPRHGTCSQGRASSFQEVSVAPSAPREPSTFTPADAAPKPGAPQDGPAAPPPVPSKGMPTAAVSAENPDEAAESHPEEHDESGEAELHAALKTLYKKTLAPVRHLVEGPQVVIVPDGPLALLPFAALVDERGRYVAESLQVRLVPSLATAKMIAKYPQKQGDPSTALIVGDPKVGELAVGEGRVPVPNLPYANEEVRMIGKLLKAEPLTAEKATKRAFLQKVDGANLIHIAAHGDATKGEILLAPDPELRRDIKLEDVMLTTADLGERRLKAQLVVLSSCHSARGEVRADGIIGIARAFLGAGARAVLVTLWAVDDEATLFFMRKFYEKLVGGMSASNSLHKAMEATRESENFNSPCYWAAFVLIGEDVTLFIV